MLTPYKDEFRFAKEFPEAYNYGRAMAYAEFPTRILKFVSGQIVGRVAFIVWKDTSNNEVKVRVEQNGSKFTVTKYADGPVNEGLALTAVKEGSAEI